MKKLNEKESEEKEALEEKMKANENRLKSYASKMKKIKEAQRREMEYA